MVIGQSTDGRSLTYDMDTIGFRLGDSPMDLPSLKSANSAGQIVWASPETDRWFRDSFPDVPSPRGAGSVRMWVGVALIALCLVVPVRGFLDGLSTTYLTHNPIQWQLWWSFSEVLFNPLVWIGLWAFVSGMRRVRTVRLEARPRGWWGRFSEWDKRITAGLLGDDKASIADEFTQSRRP